MPSATRRGVPNRLASTGIVWPFGLLEQHRRPARAQHAVADFGHLQMRIDLDRDALEFADALELGDEVAQILVFHEGPIYRRAARSD